MNDFEVCHQCQEACCECDGWISVKAELPECGKRILVYRKNYAGDSDLKIMVGYINHKEQFRGVLGELIDDDLYPHTLVTHWMPLPEPPTENK